MLAGGDRGWGVGGGLTFFPYLWSTCTFPFIGEIIIWGKNLVYFKTQQFVHIIVFF